MQLRVASFLVAALLVASALGFHLPPSFAGPTRIEAVGALTPTPITKISTSTSHAGSTALRQKQVALRATVDEATDGVSKQDISGNFDWDALAKYLIAIAVQMGLGFALATSLDKVVAMYKLKIPAALNFVLFYLMALKSRVINPLANNRPQPKTLETEKNDEVKRNMPRWTPPGFIFPIVWLLLIGPIRAATSAMVYTTTGHYACLPIMSLLLHLAVGDVWNTINNVEKRYGVSVVGVLFVWLSKAHAAYEYSRVNAVAGKLLGATLIWLTIASVLVTATWRLNPDPATNKPEPLYPTTGKVKTKFAWFSGSK